MAALGQVAIRGNAQAFEYLINRTRRHSLGELRWFASALKTELDKEIPSLLLRVTDEKSGNYQDYLNRRYENVRQQAGHREIEPAPLATVRLVESDPESETKILAGILFQQSHGSWQSAIDAAQDLSAEGRRAVLDAYLPSRKGRWYKVGRAFENAYLRFEIAMDIGSYRDLHRHRMMTQERQTFSAHHGFATPVELQHSGLAKRFEAALEAADHLFKKLEPVDRDLAQYAVPLAFRVRFYQWQNFRQLFWETELRTGSQGHPDYRFIELEKYRLVAEKFPLLASYMQVDTHDYTIARRGTEERIKEKEQRILEQLGEIRGSSGGTSNEG